MCYPVRPRCRILDSKCNRSEWSSMPQNTASHCRQLLGVDDSGRRIECPGRGDRSGYCPKHYKQWRKSALLCDYPGCRNILTIPGNGPNARRIRGRRMSWWVAPEKFKTYALCRKHEVLHLRQDAEKLALNLSRLGQGVEAGGVAGQCWIWTEGPGKRTSDGYGRMVPEGSDDQFWPAHRVSWLLLNSTGWGHEQTRELAHRCNNRACINPAHLEPATRRGNAKDKARKSRGPSQRYWGAAAHNFAVKNNLPNPFPLRPVEHPWDDGLVVEPVTEYGTQVLRGT